ncbi:MAG TPA: hypothetical protein PLY93_05635, partial [Turneriella sp.]|nr:hypothetical protein [Turneriella sp.]
MFLFILGKIYAIGTADVLFLPWRPFNAAMGGQATHSLPIESSAATNAAYLGYGQQNSFFLGFLWGNAFTGFFLDTALFSPYGGLGIGADYFKADDQTAAVRFSYGSFLSKHVGTGLTVTPRYTSAGKDQAFGFGIDPSLIIDSKWYKSMIGNDGLGIYSPAFSLTTRNLAIPLGESNLLPLSAVHIGLTTGTYQ